MLLKACKGKHNGVNFYRSTIFFIRILKNTLLALGPLFHYHGPLHSISFGSVIYSVDRFLRMANSNVWPH